MATHIDIIVPAEQEGTRAVVRAWLCGVGDRLAENDPVVELETDKVTQEIGAPAAGVLEAILLESGADAAPGDVLARLRVGEAEAPVQAPAEQSAAPSSPLAMPPAAPTPEQTREHRLSPSVRRALRQHGLDPAGIPGTGRAGRLTRADVDRAVADRAAAPAAKAAPARAPSGIRSHDVPHDRMRLRIAENMLASVTQAPHVTAVFEADFGAVLAHREARKAEFARAGTKLTVTAYVVAAAAAAMRDVPAINSRWHDDRLEVFDQVNIGIGTALGDKGLIVPVVHDAQDLSLLGIAARLDDLTRRAREGRLAGADVANGTFTISNHGVSGSLFAAPIIINQPQSAILGVGKLQKRVVVKEMAGGDTIAIRPMCYVSLTIDHRAVDGHQTNAWLTRFVDVIENWPAE